MGGVPPRRGNPHRLGCAGVRSPLEKVASREVCGERTQIVTGERRGRSRGVALACREREGKMRGAVAAHVRDNEGLELGKDIREKIEVVDKIGLCNYLMRCGRQGTKVGRQQGRLRFPALIPKRRVLPLTVIRTTGEGAGRGKRINLVENVCHLR